jgi:molecular chaperone DnaK
MGRFYNDPHVAQTKQAFPYTIRQGDGQAVLIQCGGRTFTPVEISARYLALLKARAERELGKKVDSAVITVPAYFEERQRKATREAGEKAGLRVKKIIDEPTAAALAFGIDSDQRHVLMVFDLGGGTFDISLLMVTRNQQTNDVIFHVKEIDGDNWLGGADFDQRVIDHIVKDFRTRHQVNPENDPEFLTLVRYEVECRKIDLSEFEQVQITMPAAYRDGEKTLSLNMSLTRSDFERLIEKDVDRAMIAVERALQNRSLKPDDLTAVLLVGGSTKVPLVRRRLAAIVGEEKINSDFNPMTVVAQGAAILAAQDELRRAFRSGDSAAIKERTGELTLLVTKVRTQQPLGVAAKGELTFNPRELLELR